MEGKNVLIVEDIIDSGNTLHYLVEILYKRQPKSIRICTLLDKPDRRVADVHVDYTGFEIPDEFVVGYGPVSYTHLKNIIARLRAADGCPWDRVQTHQSLRDCMIEEAYEAAEGIDIYEASGDAANLCEELGDVLLQVVMHVQIAEEEGRFTMGDVLKGISEKMIRRHPHVFGVDGAKTPEAALEN